MKWKKKERKSREGRETEMIRIKMGEVKHQNIGVELVDLRRRQANTRHSDKKSGNIKWWTSNFKGDQE